MKNYYGILNVPITASVEQIKRRYRILAKQYHPDVNKDTDTHKTFDTVTTAYKVLSDRKARVEYNRAFIKVEFKSGPVKPEIKKKKEIKVVYSRSLGVLAKRGFFLSNIPKKYRKRNDIKYDIEVIVDYYEAQKGGILKIAVPVKLPCWECNSQDHYCPICDGKGYIVRAKKIKIVIPIAPTSGEIFEVDLQAIKQTNLAVMRARKLRLKIVLTHEKTSYKQLQGYK